MRHAANLAMQSIGSRTTVGDAPGHGIAPSFEEIIGRFSVELRWSIGIFVQGRSFPFQLMLPTIAVLLLSVSLLPMALPISIRGETAAA